jgi:ubiquitin-conjugating enzyme E2 Z
MEEYLGITASGDLLPPEEHYYDSDNEIDREYEEATRAFEPFKDLCKRRFLWYYDSYLDTINKANATVKDGQSFVRMPFECPGNGMDGKFNYTELERRLRLIKKVLGEETEKWAEEGAISKRKESGVAANLQRQFEQVVEHFKKDKNVTLNIELDNNNPFVWNITYFGRPMTNLDGGMIRFKLSFSTRFPEEQPRAVFQTELFHHRIATDGTPCYTSKKSDDTRSHIESIITALEEERPPYDPRTMVNPEATKLFWGSADDKKMYNRKLRRSVQRSME